MLLVLSLAHVLNGIPFKQQFNELINGKSQTNRSENWTYYFYNDIINIEEFNSNLIKVNNKSCKDTDIYYIGYITVKKNWWLWKYLQCKSFVSDNW